MVEKAGAVVKGKLVSEKIWEEQVFNLRELTTASKKEFLKESIVSAVDVRIPNEKFGIFFSGGVDSSLIAHLCKQAQADFVCYTVGIEGAEDVSVAKKAAEEMGLDLRVKIFSLDEVEKILKKLGKILHRFDIVNAGVGAVVMAAVELAKKDKVKVFFSGLGSEEIFAGYERHASALEKHEECWKGLCKMWDRDLRRDFAIAKELGIAIVTPFLDKEVIKAAMGIPITKKISKDEKKIILRQIAEELGLPKDIAWRKKKAAQYGSKFDRAILRLAKQNGFKYKKDYLASLL